MNSKDVDFSTADLGLKSGIEEEESSDDFDAFNADTFGSEETWHEDDHEELAKCTEEERSTFHGGDDGGFFDLGEPMPTSRHQNGKHEHETFGHGHFDVLDDPAILARDIGDKIRAGNHFNHSQHPIEDPAILNVVRQQMQFSNAFDSLRLPGPQSMSQPVRSLSHHHDFPPPPHSGDLSDPAIMSMIPPASMRHQPPQRPDMMQRFQGMSLGHGGVRTLEDIERQMVAEQPLPPGIQQHMAQQALRFQHMNHQHHPMRQPTYIHQQILQNQRLQQQQQQHRFHQGPPPQMPYQFSMQQQRPPFQGGRNMSFPGPQMRNRNPFDDRNRDTFGDDFVYHHVQEQRQIRDNKHLITPGHVHVLGILRGARTREHAPAVMHSESTGNPRRDMEIQRLMSQSHLLNYDEQVSGDEYAGLMTQKEKQWVVNIQLNQLKCENPFIDDYYYTVLKLRRELNLDDKKIRGQFGPLGTMEGKSEDGEAQTSKREEEGAHLLIQPEFPRDSYMPQQFTNSLGKLQAATVKAPRKIIDVGIVNAEGNESVAQKESRNFKLTLLELERLYDLLIEVEDCEKKLIVLPTNTPMRDQVEMERCEAVKKFSANLTVAQRLKRYLMVRKGKILMKRGLRLLDPLQMGLVCTNLLQHFSSILKRDREEQLLTEFWCNGLSAHFLSAPYDFVDHYLNIIISPSYSLKAATSSTLGCSIILTLVHRCAVLVSEENKSVENEIRLLLTNLALKLSECVTFSGPLAKFPFQIPKCNLPDESIDQFLRLRNSSQA